MKADYKNWMPKGMILGALAVAVVFCIATVIIGVASVVGKVVLVLTILCALMALWMFLMHRAFSYNGTRQMSKQIIEGVASYVKIPDGGKCLDVGCGSGALSIAVAKRNPNAQVIGIDRWGKEYASFSKNLCESNSAAEGVSNTSFQQGDACKLDFPDETFDAVTSNYVYHNIPSKDRQAILLETLRTLKKGGTFAIHDIMSNSKYGDMESFVKKLKDMGYEEVKLVDTTNGMFMSKWESTWMSLSGSAILMGRKQLMIQMVQLFASGIYIILGQFFNPLYMQMWRGFFLIGILFIYVILIIVGIAGHKILAENQYEKEFHGKPYQA